MASENIDIAIVGGGVSGVYSAWRLQQHYPQSKIAVFEASDHIGGRLLSVRPPDIRTWWRNWAACASCRQYSR